METEESDIAAVHKKTRQQPTIYTEIEIATEILNNKETTRKYFSK